MTEEQKKIKVGDLVTAGRGTLKVLQIFDGGVTVYDYTCELTTVYFYKWSVVKAIEKPKAKPGFVYGNGNGYATGTHDGMLKITAISKPFDYDTSWIELPT